jgi:hypothetical protein
LHDGAVGEPEFGLAMAGDPEVIGAGDRGGDEAAEAGGVVVAVAALIDAGCQDVFVGMVSGCALSQAASLNKTRPSAFHVPNTRKKPLFKPVSVTKKHPVKHSRNNPVSQSP